MIVVLLGIWSDHSHAFGTCLVETARLVWPCHLVHGLEFYRWKPPIKKWNIIAEQQQLELWNHGFQPTGAGGMLDDQAEKPSPTVVQHLCSICAAQLCRNGWVFPGIQMGYMFDSVWLIILRESDRHMCAMGCKQPILVHCFAMHQDGEIATYSENQVSPWKQDM